MLRAKVRCQFMFNSKLSRKQRPLWQNTFYLCYKVVLLWLTLISAAQAANSVSILCYHRFGETVADSMTTRTTVFEQQLATLKQEGYSFISLNDAIEGLRGNKPLAAKSVVITVDDGHKTVYSDLLPIIRRDHLPVTLFIYPSAISNASYAMTWEQLHELAETPGVDIQAHTYWHPNFKVEKKRLSPEDYQKFVETQLTKSRSQLKKKLGVDATYMAWPFGIYDDELKAYASKAGYSVALALDGRNATTKDSLLSLPRYLIVDANGVKGLSNLLKEGEK